MVTEATTSRGVHGYYRQDNGWIEPSSADSLERLKYEEQGWQFLHEIGTFFWGRYYMEHPLEVLFLRGGAHLLPVEQVVAMGFHNSPPLVPTCGLALGPTHQNHTRACWIGAQPVTFPQLDGLDLPGPQHCEYCDRSDLPTPAAKEQHIKVMHKDRLGMRELGGILVEGMRPPARDKAKAGDYVCGRCGEGFTNAFKLNAHLTEHKRQDK
jgi:hypothetical protein